MIWALFAFGSAVFDAGKSAFGKKLTKSIDEYLTGWALFFFGVPMMAIAVYFTGIPALSTNFWYAIVASTIINIFATVFYMKALSHSDLSLVVPLTSFMIVSATVSGMVFHGEFPSFLGYIGLAVTFVGAYTLKLKKNHNLFEPIKALYHDKGCRYMIITSLLWGFNAGIDKQGIENSNPYFYLFMLSVLVGLAMIPIIWKQKYLKETTSNIGSLLIFGTLNSAVILLFFLAIEIYAVAYVVAVRSAAPLIGILFGYLFFKEKNILKRTGAALLMIAGMLIVLFA